MEIRKNPEVDGVCGVACLELGEDTVTQQTGTNCLHRIGKNPIIYENYFPLRKQALLSQSQLKYVEDIGKPWGVKEGGDTDIIRHRTVKFLCPRIESIGFIIQ